MINEFENFLRQLILEILGDETLIYKVSDERISRWKDKKEIQIKKDNGLCYEDRLIFYSDIYDLKTIISKNWEDFKPVLLDKKRFDVFFDEIESYRNTVMHGRNLLKSQKLILEGILMDLKTLKTVYHNKNEMKEDYFIRITKVSDNLGNIWEKGKYNNPKPILRAGDVYEIFVEAFDPKGREINYKFMVDKAMQDIVQKENRLIYTLTSDSIGQRETIFAIAFTQDSEYKNEDQVGIDITVLPTK